MADCGVGARLEVLRPVENDDFDASMAILKRGPGSNNRSIREAESERVLAGEVSSLGSLSNETVPETPEQKWRFPGSATESIEAATVRS